MGMKLWECAGGKVGEGCVFSVYERTFCPVAADILSGGPDMRRSRACRLIL